MDKQIIYNKYCLQKKSLKAIAKEFHISDKTLIKFMNENNIPIRSKNLDEISKENKEMIEKLYKEGKNPREISEIILLPSSKIKSYLLNNNIWVSKEKLDKNEIKNLYLDKDLTVREIANMKDCSIKKIHNVTKNYQKRGCSYIFNRKELDLLYNKYCLPVTEIAKIKNTSRYYVLKSLEKYKMR